MKQNFDYCLNQVLKFEGGYGNDPQDPGGPTNFGITIIDYRKYINPRGTAEDVRHMKLEDAKRIYKKEYWDELNLDGQPSGVDYCLFDYGVNSGVGRARKVLARYKNITDPVKLINAICDERISFLRALSTFHRFGKGWTARVAAVRIGSIKLAHQHELEQDVKMNTVTKIETPQVAIVPVESAWYSKINLTQIVAGAAMVLTYFTGGKVGLDANQQASLIVTIGLVGQLATLIWRTFYNAKTNPLSLFTLKDKTNGHK